MRASARGLGQRRWVEALVVCVLIVFAAASGLPLGPLRAPAGLVATLFAPGYALLLAVRPQRLTAIGRALLSVPLSLAVVTACGVGLNASPYGVHPDTLAVATGVVTLALLAAAYADPVGRRRVWGSVPMPRAPWTWSSPVARAGALVRTGGAPFWLSVATSVALLVAAAWATDGIVRASRDLPAPFTEFYLLEAGPEGPGEARVRIGVRNHEGVATRYLVRVTLAPAGPGGNAGAGDSGPPEGVVVEREVLVPGGAEHVVEARLRLACGDSVEARLWQLAGPSDQPSVGPAGGLGSAGEPYRRLRVRPDCAAG